MHKRPSQQKCLSNFRCDLTLQTYQIKLSATLYVKIHETGGKVLNMLTQCHFLLTFSLQCGVPLSLVFFSASLKFTVQPEKN